MMKRNTKRRQYKIPTLFRGVAGIVFSIALTVGFVAATLYAASSLTPPAPPSPQGYTLDDIYYRITEGREVAKGSSASLLPQGQMYSLEDIYQALGASDGQVALPAKTGQTVSYSTGDDGDIKAGTPRSYTDNGDGTITDNTTGLVWQKCHANRSGSNCETGANSSAAWSSAISLCNNLNLAGRSWRLPSITELITLIDYGQNAPAINGTFFPNTPSSGNFWTSTEYFLNPDLAFRISFSNGSTSQIDKTTTNSMYRRCVS